MIARVKHKLKGIAKKICKKELITVPVVNGEILAGKTVLITGGGSGIGLSIAKVCGNNGANVIICGRNITKLEEAHKEIMSNVELYPLDISDEKKIDSEFNGIIEKTKFEKIDILVNNAGISKGAIFPETNYEDLSDTLDTNLKGTYMLSEIFANYLIDHHIKGNILNICSTSGNRPAISPYMVSKWGEIGFTKGFAKRLINYGIVVNGIAPGPTATGMLMEMANGDLSYEKSPAGRYVAAEEIANLALFLISDMGRMIVGETVFITGGCGTLTFDDISY